MLNLLVGVILVGLISLIIWHLSKTDFWERHVCMDFDKTGHHTECFDCNEGNEICYNDPERCGAMRWYIELKEDNPKT